MWWLYEADVMKEFFTRRRNEVVGMILEEFTTEHVEQYIKEMEEENAEQRKQIEIKDAEIARLKAIIEAEQKKDK